MMRDVFSIIEMCMPLCRSSKAERKLLQEEVCDDSEEASNDDSILI